MSQENHALWNSTTPVTRLDVFAMAITPFRRPVAHFSAQNAVVGNQGYFADNEYSREALSGITSGTF
ncbi:hypothetical protein GCM10011350_15040 [Marinomonas arctica]|nr:hypothetical protein GCM10011350_15040 [Marinomonas arctica]